ncbi:hypothetical protein ASE36_00260 [Rhizobium sp. Root274]|uniref:hypothetical protein n=1 Tax=unclassified Rhizobium TaxID=2613769 RepID=UPI0007130199|nr:MULTISPECIES: hypothetical protein [unclassified Rhizobium]KQW30771.1 hypothetical protein ASC71_00260 [Rhizobium sp. Root1240]KRD32318.1 hypothetical protein ASE36_00260 [Rhizobium sp. Root274]
MQKIFTCDGYDFWRDDSGHWNVAHKGDGAPSHCAYATPDAIATLKGVNLRAGMEWHPSEYTPDPVREAAPDMLAALKAIKKARGNCGASPFEQAACRLVDSAIEKAEGRANG